MAGSRDPRIFLDTGRWLVTSSLLATRNRFYPIANTTARIRRDPLWTALAVTAVAALATRVYGDLLYPVELLLLWSLAGLALAAGLGTAILHVDAAGHRTALVFGTAPGIGRLYRAIRDARLHAHDPGMAVADASE